MICGLSVFINSCICRDLPRRLLTLIEVNLSDGLLAPLALLVTLIGVLETEGVNVSCWLAVANVLKELLVDVLSSHQKDDEKEGMPQEGQIQVRLAVLIRMPYMCVERPLHRLWTQRSQLSQHTAGSFVLTAREQMLQGNLHFLGPGFSSMSPEVSKQISSKQRDLAGR